MTPKPGVCLPASSGAASPGADAAQRGSTPLFARAGVATPAGVGARQLAGEFRAEAPLFAEFINELRTAHATPPDMALTQARWRFFGNLSAHRPRFGLPVS